MIANADVDTCTRPHLVPKSDVRYTGELSTREATISEGESDMGVPPGVVLSGGVSLRTMGVNASCGGCVQRKAPYRACVPFII